MQPLSNFSAKIKYLFCDIDDTLTTGGKLPANSYESLWQLQKQGIEIIPVTGRPAGWCEMIARLWPVKSIIGENGGFYFKYENKKMHRHFFIDENTRRTNQEQLDQIKQEVLTKVPGSAIASDQFTRLMDLAVDFCEDVPALKKDDVKKIKSIFESHGAIAKISSIHVNGWFGNYDKLTAVKYFCKKELKLSEEQSQSQCAFIGDSPNDEPMFGYFQNSVGVSNVNEFRGELRELPKFICENKNADGFVELTHQILSKH